MTQTNFEIVQNQHEKETEGGVWPWPTPLAEEEMILAKAQVCVLYDPNWHIIDVYYFPDFFPLCILHT